MWVKAQTAGTLFDPLDSSGSTEGGLLHIGCYHEDFTVPSVLLETEFYFDVGEEARVVGELGFFGKEDTVLPEELEVLHEALVDRLVYVSCAVEILQVSGVPLVAPFDTAVCDMKAEDAPISEGTFFGVGWMVFGPFEEVQDHLLREGTLLFGHALPFFIIANGVGDGFVRFAGDGVDEGGLLPVAHCLEVGGSSLEVFPNGCSFDERALEGFSDQKGEEVEATDFVCCLELHAVEGDIFEVQGQS